MTDMKNTEDRANEVGSNRLVRRPLFSIQRGYSGREANATWFAAGWIGGMWKYEDAASSGTIPIGSVEYCEPPFGEHRKDFYPEFLRGYMRRWTEHTHGPWLLNKPLFVKDASRWKSETASRVMQPGEVLQSGDWLISQPVHFEQEWRYYVADGSLVTTGWYRGEDEDEPAPQINVTWPEGFSGAVDFGRLDDGRIALVECHAPFACGWYGDDHKDYVLWQAVAWEKRDWWLLKTNASGQQRLTESVTTEKNPENE